MIVREFHCPKCQGRTFGGLPDRMCHGQIFVAQRDGSGNWKAEPCRFMWNSKDDWKYMRLIVTMDDETDNIDAIVTSAVLHHQHTRPLSGKEKAEEEEDESPPPEGTLAPI